MKHILHRYISSLIAGVALAMLASMSALPALAQTATPTAVPLTLTPATATPTLTSTPLPATATPVPSTSTATPIPTSVQITATPIPTSTAVVVTSTPSFGSFIGGTIFEDQNLDQVFNSKEKTKKDVTVRLLYSSGGVTSNATIKLKTNDDGYYEFKNLLPGTYLVTVEMPDGYIGTTAEQWEVKVNGIDGTRIVNFGILKTTNIYDANATVTVINGTVTTTYGSGSSGSSSSRGGLVGGGTSGGTSGGVTYGPTSSPTPTATPTSTPTLTPIQKLKLFPPMVSARFFMEGHANDNGLLYDYAADGSALQSGEVDMELTINSKQVDVVALGPQTFIRAEDSETWATTSTAMLRNWYGVLSALDIMNLSTLDKMVLDVRPTRFTEQIDGEMVMRVDVLLVNQIPTPNPLLATQTAGSGVISSSAGPSGSSTPQPVNVTGLYPSTGGIYPQLRNDPGVSVSQPVVAPSAAPNQLQIIDGIIELWVAASDGYVRAAHLRLNMPSARLDRPGRLEPVSLDAWVWYSDVNQAFTISAPTSLTPPTPQPALATAIARATEEARNATNASASSSSGSTSGPIPVPVRGGLSDPSPGGSTSGGAQPGGAQPQPKPIGTPDPNVTAAERALLALASASGPRTGSKVTETGIMLDVPWRGLQDPAGANVATDGPTALGMILEAFGVTAPTADLQALAARWQESKTDGDSVSIETLVRIAERGALRPIGTGRGPGGGDWTAVMARDFLRRGYPVLALVRPQIITGGAVAPDQPDRFIVIVGFEGDELIYHDPAVEGGAALRVSATTLDQAWIQATPPRQGVVFGFGASVVGLLDGPGRSAQVKPEATATATSISVRATPTVLVIPPSEPLEVAPSESGPHPALLAFLGILAGGVGFLIARMYR